MKKSISAGTRALAAAAVIAGSIAGAVAMAPLAGACPGPLSASGPANDHHGGSCILPIPPRPHVLPFTELNPSDPPSN